MADNCLALKEYKLSKASSPENISLFIIAAFGQEFIFSEAKDRVIKKNGVTFAYLFYLIIILWR